jgi:hypothetical protein
MASIERTAYPRFRPSLSERELETLYEPTPRERGFAEKNTRSPQGRLTLLVFLKFYQHLGYLPQAEEVPEQVTDYLADYLDSAAAPELGARRQERHRYQKSIRDFLGTQSRQNQLYRAFRELGRVVRTGLLLEYISTAELRRSIHAATTKIEPRAPSPIGSASAATSSAPAIPRGRRSESSTATSPGMQ